MADMATGGMLGMSPELLSEILRTGTKVLGTTLGAIGTAINSRKYNKEIDNINQRKKDLQSFYNTQQTRIRQNAATPYTHTAEGANAIRTIQGNAEDIARSVGEAGFRNGGSAEALVAGASEAQRNNADAVARVAAAGTEYRMGNEAILRQNEQQQLAAEDALERQRLDLRMQQINASNRAWGALAQ